MKSRLLITVIAFLTACTQPAVRMEGDLMVLDVERVPEGDDIPLSQIADEAEVIQLEAADDAFCRPGTAFMSPHYVIIRHWDNSCALLFRRDGHFIGRIKPTDDYYGGLHDLLIDEARGVVYVTQWGACHIDIYDLHTAEAKSRIQLKANCNKGVLGFTVGGELAVAHIDFYDHYSGFNAAVCGEPIRYLQRPGLNSMFFDDEGCSMGFNEGVIGYQNGTEFSFGFSSNDTLFRLNSTATAIEPLLAMNMSHEHNGDGRLFHEDNNILYACALPCHFVVEVRGADYRTVVIDRRSRKAVRAKIVCDHPGLEDVKPYFANEYAYTILPAEGTENCTVVRWRLHSTPQEPHKGGKPVPAIQRPDDTPSFFGEASIDTAFYYTPDAREALAIVDSVIACSGAKRGHPTLAYAYAVKAALMADLRQRDSVAYYERLVNAPLAKREEQNINERMMETYKAQGDMDEAQRYAIAYGVSSDMAQGSQYYIEVAENRSRITDMREQLIQDARLRHILLVVLGGVVAASLLLFIYTRRKKQQQLLATRRELQSRMERRIDEATSQMRSELMTNHALVHRLSDVARGGQLTTDEEDMLHHLADMLFEGFTTRLQERSTVTLTKRELTICILMRFGVSQADICTLLGWKGASLRTSKSRLKRDRFCLPTDAELEDFIVNL